MSMGTRGSFPLRAEVRLQLEHDGREFLAEFLARATRRHPDNVEALAELGHVLTRLGRFHEGLEVDRRLVELVPDNATAHYNLACSLSLMGETQGALDALERSVELGYDDLGHLVDDDDLAPLRAEPRFRDLARRLGDPPAGL